MQTSSSTVNTIKFSIVMVSYKISKVVVIIQSIKHYAPHWKKHHIIKRNLFCPNAYSNFSNIQKSK